MGLVVFHCPTMLGNAMALWVHTSHPNMYTADSQRSD